MLHIITRMRSNPRYKLGRVSLFSRARPTLNLPCISPQNSVTCNGEYRRPVIEAQPSFHEMAERKHMSNVSTFKRTDSHTVRGRPTRKDGVVIYERLF